ncbi:MAG: hypothetical protein AABY63_01040 [candidate division NC10 bacterium]
MRPYRSLPRIIRLIPVVLIFCAYLPTASAGGPYWVDERAGSLTVVGTGRPPATALHPAQARLMAERAAVIDAYGTAARVLSGAIPQAVSGGQGHSLFFRGGKVVQSDVLPDGSVNVHLEIPLSAALAAEVKSAVPMLDESRRQEDEKPGISHEEFVARHRVRGPRVITLREWIERYRTGAWLPYTQSQ